MGDWQGVLAWIDAGGLLAVLALQVMLMRSRRGRAAARSRKGTPAAPPPPLPAVDLHVAMNSLNRIAGQAYLVTGEQDEEVFLLVDYLRQALAQAASLPVALAREVALLDGFAQLAARGRGWRLETRASLDDGVSGMLVPSHLLCSAAHCLMSAFAHVPRPSGDETADALLHLEIGRDGSRLEMVMGLRLQTRAGAAVPDLARAQADFAALADTLRQAGKTWHQNPPAAVSAADIEVRMRLEPEKN